MFILAEKELTRFRQEGVIATLGVNGEHERLEQPVRNQSVCTHSCKLYKKDSSQIWELTFELKLVIRTATGYIANTIYKRWSSFKWS